MHGSRMNCPDCGQPMESGYAAAESFVGGIKWAARKGRLGAQGPTLAKPDRLGMVYLAGSRCTDCRLLLLRY